MFCGEKLYAIGSASPAKPYRFSSGDRTGFGPAFTGIPDPEPEQPTGIIGAVCQVEKILVLADHNSMLSGGLDPNGEIRSLFQ